MRSKEEEKYEPYFLYGECFYDELLKQMKCLYFFVRVGGSVDISNILILFQSFD